MEKTYNGWTNYETWLVKLWLDNDEGSCRYCEELAKQAKNAYDLSNQLKDMIEEDAPDLGANMYSDLLTAAISEVNWYEIAEHYMEEKEND
jgi:thioredoxin-related protein